MTIAPHWMAFSGIALLLRRRGFFGYALPLRPRGEVACVLVGGRAYLLQAAQPGCGGRNLFSGIDPIAEVASGISFTNANDPESPAMPHTGKRTLACSATTSAFLRQTHP